MIRLESFGIRATNSGPVGLDRIVTIEKFGPDGQTFSLGLLGGRASRRD